MPLQIQSLNIEVKRTPRRKTVSIAIYPESRIVVSAPIRFPESQIKDLLEQKQQWINEKLKQIALLPARRPVRKFIGGELFPLLGQDYPLQDMITMPEGLNDEKRAAAVKRRLAQWYQDQALSHFQTRVEYFAQFLRVRPRTVKIKNYAARWGTCSSTGDITLNWRLIMAPQSVIDYVVVHELCHLLQMNHSPKFWKLVASILPQYKQSKQWLKVADYRGELTF